MSTVTLSTKEGSGIAKFIDGLHVPGMASHKGQNGKVLVIGGSSLFHGAVLWSAEAASYFSDMVHVASTEENNVIIRSIKEKWRNGIVVSQQDIPSYIPEDDVVLLGNGMMRTEDGAVPDRGEPDLEEALGMKNEGERTFFTTRALLRTYPDKRWVLDAGALQMMKPEWLSTLQTPSIITPHQKEFEKLFGVPVLNAKDGDKADAVIAMAKKYRTVILMKAGYDLVSDGTVCYRIEGGNAGLTKGGTGDILAGIAAALYAKNEAVVSAVCASVILKSASDDLALTDGLWYNTTGVLARIPQTVNRLMKQYNRSFSGQL